MREQSAKAREFDPHAYGNEVAEILALDGNGERLMPLAQGSCSSPEAHERLQTASAAALFPRARAAAAAFAGLWLYFSCWEEAHQIAQDIGTREGSYWHAIIHRQEPDAWNAGYWLRGVGAHPIFPELTAVPRRSELIWAPDGTRWRLSNCASGRARIPGRSWSYRRSRCRQSSGNCCFTFARWICRPLCGRLSLRPKTCLRFH